MQARRFRETGPGSVLFRSSAGYDPLELLVNVRLVRHIVSAVISWALFGYYWNLVAQRRITDNTITGIQILLVLVLVIWALTALWVQHNRRRYAGRPDRRTRRTASRDLAESDAIGQLVSVVGVGPPLAVADYVVIEVDQESRRKTFRVEDVPEEGGAP